MKTEIDYFILAKNLVLKEAEMKHLYDERLLSDRNDENFRVTEMVLDFGEMGSHDVEVHYEKHDEEIDLRKIMLTPNINLLDFFGGVSLDSIRSEILEELRRVQKNHALIEADRKIKEEKER